MEPILKLYKILICHEHACKNKIFKLLIMWNINPIMHFYCFRRSRREGVLQGRTATPTLIVQLFNILKEPLQEK